MLSAQMMQSLQEGIVVTVVGMGVVFSFLIILIVGMYVMSFCVQFLNKIFPPVVIENTPRAKRATTMTDDDIAVAIAVACIKNR